MDLHDSLMERARARVGQVLKDKWTLDRLLGVGGMAAVYAATHRNGKRVAVKMLHPELSIDAEIRRRFLREGYVANKIEHAGAVSVQDDDVCEDGSVFLVMDLLEGETLDARWRRKGCRIDVGEILSVADQVLDVLAAAHDKGIVHRDLKPENLFITREGVVKVLDFGIARLREMSTQSQATRSGMTMGTPAFMPPEQARGLWDEVDGRTDLWAVGATMFALATGRHVHEGRTPNEQLLSAMTARAPALASLVATSQPFAHLVDRALAYDKAERWPDARTMQIAVREAYHATAGAPVSTAPRLVVPELAQAGPAGPIEGRSQATPGASVATGQGPTPRSPTLWRSRMIVSGAVASVAVIAVVAALRGRGGGPPVATEPSATPAAAPVTAERAPTATVVQPTSSAPAVTPAAERPIATASAGPKAPPAPAVGTPAAAKPATTGSPAAAKPDAGDMLDRRR